MNGDNLNNIRHKASRHLRIKSGKINELAENNKKKNIRNLVRGINEFKKAYQPRSNLMKDENGDLLADSYNILNRWKKYFSQLLKVHSVSGVSQIEIGTAANIT
jgi:hypothetical protein